MTTDFVPTAGAGTLDNAHRAIPRRLASPLATLTVLAWTDWISPGFVKPITFDDLERRGQRRRVLRGAADPFLPRVSWRERHRREGPSRLAREAARIRAAAAVSGSLSSHSPYAEARMSAGSTAHLAAVGNGRPIAGIKVKLRTKATTPLMLLTNSCSGEHAHATRA